MSASALIALNVWIAWRLFHIEYTIHTAALDGVYIAIARFIQTNGPFAGWFPFWRCGIPFEQVYQPLFHIATAALSSLSGVSVAYAYHAVGGAAYSLGPATVFWMVLQLHRSIPVAFVSGLLYSLVSPASLIVPAIALDTGGAWFARRLHTAVAYSDTPHIAGLALVPLVIVFADRARVNRTFLPLAIAALLAAAVILTNIPATIVLGMAIAAYALAYAKREYWWQIAFVPVAGAALAIGVFPPSIMHAITANLARYEPANRMTGAHFLGFTVAAIILPCAAWALRRTRVSAVTCFAGFFFFLVGGVALANYWFGWTILAQPGRMQIAMEMPIVMLLAIGAAWLVARLPRPRRAKARVAFLLIAIIAGAFQIANLRQGARRLIRPIDARYLSEYQSAKWIEANDPSARVYAGGSTMFWLNAFADVHQVTGCCEQSIALPVTQMMRYVIGTDDHAGDRAFPVSLAWLQTFGAKYVIVRGPRSTDPYSWEWAHPEKFTDRLREVTREGGNVIYEVPQPSASIAHSIRPGEVISTYPENGLDVEPFAAYIAGIEDPARPILTSKWENAETLRVTGEVPAGQLISIQIPYHAGWIAILKGRAVPLRPDAVGLMVLDPQSSGPLDLRLSFGEWPELIVCRIVSIATLAGLLLAMVYTQLRIGSVFRSASPLRGPIRSE